jgi:hypothetical protein
MTDGFVLIIVVCLFCRIWFPEYAESIDTFLFGKSNDDSKDVPKDVPEDVPEDVPANVPEDVHANVHANVHAKPDSSSSQDKVC